MKRLTAILVAAILLFTAPAFFAQNKQEKKQEKIEEQPQVITIDVQLVNVDAFVTTKNGQPITELKREHFRILEDGVPQEITHFAPTEAPITIVVLVEFSKLAYGYFAYQSIGSAYGFLDELQKDDWVALVSFDLNTRIEVDFTRNKHEVKNHLARMYYPTFTEASLFKAVVETLERLKDVEGKKAILLVASGFDTGLGKYMLDDALKACRQTDATIFSVGVGRDFIEYYRLDNVNYFQAQNQLNSFARATGGRAWFPRFQGELPGIFKEVTSYLRSQYGLGYVPSNPKYDGKFHKIKVELVGADGEKLVIKDQNGKNVKYKIYAREGYIAPKGPVD